MEDGGIRIDDTCHTLLMRLLAVLLNDMRIEVKGWRMEEEDRGQVTGVLRQCCGCRLCFPVVRTQ